MGAIMSVAKLAGEDVVVGFALLCFILSHVASSWLSLPQIFWQGLVVMDGVLFVGCLSTASITIAIRGGDAPLSKADVLAKGLENWDLLAISQTACLVAGLLAVLGKLCLFPAWLECVTEEYENWTREEDGGYGKVVKTETEQISM